MRNTFDRVALWLLVLLHVTLTPSTALAQGGLDLKDWLTRPGVKLVAVEFYATWCKPCMKAVPQWKALHEKYRARGLRLLVVSVQDQGMCAAPDWNPDAVICDEEGHLQAAWKADVLPQAFLWSWQGNLLQAHAPVERLEEAVLHYFETSPRIVVSDPVDAVGEVLAESGSLKSAVRAELARVGKFDVIADSDIKAHLRELKKAGFGAQYDEKTQCKMGMEVSANSQLRITLRQSGNKQRLLLELFSIENGCLVAGARAPVMDGDLDAAVVDAISQLVRGLGGKVVFPSGKRTDTARVEEKAIGATDNWKPDDTEPVIVRFVSDPPGAIVMLDGKLLCQDTGQGCSRMVTPGAHVVTMQKEGFGDRTESVRIAGESEVSWKLASNSGYLSVNSTPPGLEVLLNKKGIGRTPISRLALPSGAYEIVVSGPRHLETGRRFQLDPGEHEAVELTPPVKQGAIYVSAIDTSGNALKATVEIDGRKVGVTPATFKIAVGRHLVKVRHASTFWEKTVEVEFQQVARAEAVLKLGRIDKKPRPRDPVVKEPDEKKGATTTALRRFSAGLFGVGGMTLYDGHLYTNSFGAELQAGFRLLKEAKLWVELSYLSTIESPISQFLSYGIRYGLGPVFARIGGINSLIAEGAYAGAYGGLGAEFGIIDGLFVGAEVETQLFFNDVYPFLGKLGVRYAF